MQIRAKTGHFGVKMGITISSSSRTQPAERLVNRIYLSRVRPGGELGRQNRLARAGHQLAMRQDSQIVEVVPVQVRDDDEIVMPIFTP